MLHELRQLVDELSLQRWIAHTSRCPVVVGGREVHDALVVDHEPVAAAVPSTPNPNGTPCTGSAKFIPPALEIEKL